MKRLAALILGLLLASDQSRAWEKFPFVLPWDDATPSVTDLSFLNVKPAGKQGFVSARNGHLFVGDQRIRFFGVNVCFGANFPEKEVAPKIAARMAKLGINCVRFHHMDMQSAPTGIFAADGRSLDPERLDRLDFFIAELKAVGIYTNLNLHVSRTYPDRAKSEKEGNPNYDKGVDNFAKAMIDLQKEYARMLLTHPNPYTGKTYAEEPAVAFVEINNENALLEEWHTGGLDGIATPYRKELDERWTQFLTSRHGSDENIARMFSEGARPAGEEMLANGDFARRGERWFIEQHDGSKCEAEYSKEGVTLKVSGSAKEAWHVQLTQTGLTVEQGRPYTVRFRAKASGSEKIQVALSQAHAPWRVLDSRSVMLGTQDQDFELTLRATEADTNVRLAISGLARSKETTFSLGGFSLRSAAVVGGLSRNRENRFDSFTRDEYARRSAVAQEEWMRFLSSIEQNYWPSMRRFLREELQVRALVIGTQLGWSPFPIQREMDVIDSHAYWQHPHFPGRPWDPGNWTVRNLPMAGAAGGGTVPRLALQRVAGKPYICTEYNHAAPNDFRAETFPLICSYAALQDWDGVFAFAYSHRRDAWEQRYVANFFDIDQDPARLVPMVGAVLAFRRGDIQAAREARYASISLTEAILQTGETGPRLGAELFGVGATEALIRRTGVRLTNGERFAASPAPAGPVYASDTNELTWDTTARVAAVDAPRCKAVTGEGKGRVSQLGDVRFVVESDWACLQALVIEGENFAKAKRVLISATSLVENTEQQWQDANRITVGRQWGKAPSLALGVRGSIQLPSGPKWKVWALDERGARRDEVPISGSTLKLDPAHRTLWYEAVAE